VVSDVIEEVLKEHAGSPVKKDDLVSEVMSRRMVKRNTVLVSLANKKKFKKVGKDSFVLA
jgi:DNA-binding winged helix-turn-helix (wHTH) protein